jgi:hypothetical protein
MTTINGFPISNALVDTLQRYTYEDLGVKQTQFQSSCDQIVEITYKLIELMDTDDVLGEVQVIKGFLINLGNMREMMNDFDMAILQGFKSEKINQ